MPRFFPRVKTPQLLLMVLTALFAAVDGLAASAAVTIGKRVTLTASASGTAPFTYQWYKNGVRLSGASGVSFVLASYQAGDAGSYTCAVANNYGSTTSDAAVLSTGSVLTITASPVSKTVTTGTATSFTVTVSDTAGVTYQWRKNGTDIAGATAANFTLGRVRATDAGTYTVVVTNANSRLTSASAVLTVVTVQAGFDVAGYLARNADLASVYANDPAGAWQHFWNYGLNEGRTFDALFKVDEYLELNPDLKQGFGNDRQAALLHWLEYGSSVEDRMGRVPIGFDVDRYLNRYPDLKVVFGAVVPLGKRNVAVWNHYLEYGVREGRSDGDFEALAYLRSNADLAVIYGTDLEAAAVHWYFYGRREGRRIPANFDVAGYRARNPDVVVIWGADLYGCWLHYRDSGVYENRNFDDRFRVLEYRARYADVQKAYGNDLTGVLLHWLHYGRAEGRLGRNP